MYTVFSLHVCLQVRGGQISLQMVVATLWLLEIELRTSVREGSVLNHRVISSDPSFCFFKTDFPCVDLAVLEWVLYNGLASNSEIHLPLPGIKGVLHYIGLNFFLKLLFILTHT